MTILFSSAMNEMMLINSVPFAQVSPAAEWLAMTTADSPAPGQQIKSIPPLHGGLQLSMYVCIFEVLGHVIISDH